MREAVSRGTAGTAVACAGYVELSRISERRRLGGSYPLFCLPLLNKHTPFEIIIAFHHSIAIFQLVYVLKPKIKPLDFEFSYPA
jgi:hypothetical protein